MVFLGERGQAKIAHHPRPAALLDARVPVVAGCADQRRPVRADLPRVPPAARGARATRCRSPGSAATQRYGEKLATPDVSIADLIGEIDPIKVAEGRYLADEETIHYGLIPRTNRGIFAINELPDLTEKVQVGLFNLMEEKDVQIKGYKIRLPLDVVIVASANPEDYTSRGRIITPLKDRFDVQIRTHYPRTLEDEIAIMEQEVPALRPRRPRRSRVPRLHEGDRRAAHLRGARLATRSTRRPGVSVRVTINNYESAASRNAEKRARAPAASARSCRASPTCTRCSRRPPARSSSSTPARRRRTRT